MLTIKLIKSFVESRMNHSVERYYHLDVSLEANEIVGPENKRFTEQLRAKC